MGQSRDVIIRLQLPYTGKNTSASASKEADGDEDADPILRARLTYRRPEEEGEYELSAEGPQPLQPQTSRGLPEAFAHHQVRVSVVCSALCTFYIDARSQAVAIQEAEFASQLFRLRAVDVLQLAMVQASKEKNFDLSGGHSIVLQIIGEVRAWLSSEGKRLAQCDSTKNSLARVEALLRDLDGQIKDVRAYVADILKYLCLKSFYFRKAFSNSDWYNRWGVHYVPSISRAHQLQQCNNFKVLLNIRSVREI